MSSMATATTDNGSEAPNNQALQPAFDVSRATQVNVPETTKAGKPRKRMKWTPDLNSFIMRSYYRITKFETDMTNYRYALHRAFVKEFPQYDSITEQRVADQRRAIVNNNLIPAPMLQQIYGEVELEMQREEGNVIPQEIEPANSQPIGDNNGNENTSQTSTDECAVAELNRALAEFDGTNPAQRPKLPKLKTNKNTKTIITSLNNVLRNYAEEHNSLEKLHSLIYCGAVAVLRSHNQQIRIPEQRYTPNNKKNKQKPVWQRRLEGVIGDIRCELGRLTEFTSNESPSRRLKAHVRKIFRKIGTHRNNPNHQQTIDEYMDKLRQTLKAKSKRLNRYVKCSQRKQQNQLFKTHEKQFYRKLSDGLPNSNERHPGKQELTEYWSSLWSTAKEHKKNAHWINTEQMQRNITPMHFISIELRDVTSAINSTNSWKAPGVDNIQNFWYKKFDSLHGALAEQLTHVIHHPKDMPAFLTLGSTYMLPKSDLTEDPAHYRPITCLPTLYKILTACITNKIYKHVEENNILAEEQKGCKRDHRGCKEQLVIDSVVLGQAQKEQRHIYTAFIDYKKAFDSVPHSWLIHVLQIYNVHPTIVAFLESISKQWRTNLHLQVGINQINTDEIYIRRGIFQGDSLSPLWFCLAMNPLSNMLNDTGYGFKIKANRNTNYTISHLIYMDDIKLYATNKKQLNDLINISDTFSRDIYMEFGMDKCRTLNIEKGKTLNGDALLPNGEIMRALEKGETYKYLGFQQARLLEHKQAKTKVRELYIQRVRKLLKSQLHAGNLIKAINTYATPILTYSFGILKWTDTELAEVQRTTRTMMTKYNIHHPKASTLRTTLPRKEGGRGLIDIANLHCSQLIKLRDFFYMKAESTELHRAIKLADKNYTPLNLSLTNKQLTPIGNAEKKLLWAQKELHGRHYNEMNQPHVDKEASNRWLRDGMLFPETEGFMVAIQDQVIGTNNYRKFIIKDSAIESDKCRKCHQKSETIQHITSGCAYLANIDYLHRHNQICNIIHQKLANKYGLLNTYTPYYKYKPQSVLENESFRLYYDRAVITDKQVTNNRPDIVVVEKKDKHVILVDVAVPNNNNIFEKYQEKKAKYAELAIEIKQMWRMEKVEVVPIIISSTGLVPKTIHEGLTKLGLHKNTYVDIQKAAILGTCHLVRKFLQT